MNCYIDSSVILRILMDSEGAIRDFGRYDRIISSELLLLECNRVIDRYRLAGLLDDEQVSEIKQRLKKISDGMYIIEINDAVKSRTGGAFPTIIGTLDAIHLSTALLLKEHEKADDMVILSHDRQMLVCAKALGFSTLEK
jgi:hypothetical protein